MLGYDAQYQHASLSPWYPARPDAPSVGNRFQEDGGGARGEEEEGKERVEEEGDGLFIPMQDEAPLAPQSVQEEEVVMSSTLGRIRVSSAMGFFVPRIPSAASSSASGGSGASSLRVSTSSFCSSQETLVDGDSDYRTSHRSERRKHFNDEISASARGAAAAHAAAAATGHGSLVSSRATAPQATRTACPLPSGRPPSVASKDKEAHYHRTSHECNARGMANETADCDRPASPRDSTEHRSPDGHSSCGRDDERNRAKAKEARRRENARRRERGEGRAREEAGTQYYPEGLWQGAKATPEQASEAADVWEKTFGASSLLMPTDSYDFTVQLALWKIQHYR